jgi:EmrB/QacA subfamily drug resistance transporter
MPPDPASPAADAAAAARQAQAAKMIPFIVGCALFMQMLDSTSVATALPAMAVSLDTTAVRLNVAITSYLLAAAVFVPVSGWAADRYGARRVFIAAIILFASSSAACALASNIWQLVAARIFQGLAGAMTVPVGRIILLRTVPKENLLRAMSLLSMPALIGPMIGPPVGGFIVTYLSWHWIFLMNIPIGVLGIWMVLRYIDEIRDENAPALDVSGFLLSSISLACLVSGLEVLGHGLGPLSLSLPLLGAGLGAGLLYARHARRAPHPIIDLTLLRIPTFAIAALAGNLCRFAVGALPFLLSVLLQVGFGYSPLETGLLTFIGAVGSLAMKFVTTPIISHIGFRRVLWGNAVLTGLSVMACAAFSADTPAWAMMSVLLVSGLCRSLQFTAVNALTYADINREDMSRASSFASMVQQLGVSLGVGLAASVIHVSMAVRGAETLAAADVSAGFVLIGLLCASSALSFLRLPAKAGAHLNKHIK